MENKQPFVNIIILNWNNYRDTEECLESIKKIDYKKYGVTIIDNNSADASGKKLIKKYKKDKKIKIVVNKKNLGFAGGSNFGMRIDLFNADYFLLLNNDTIVDKRFLTNLINTKKDLISPLVYNYYSKKELSRIDSPGKFNFFTGGAIRLKINGSGLCRVDYASGCCWLLKKELFTKTSGFNDKYFLYNEEVEFGYRLKKEGYNFYISTNSKIWHKGGRTSNKVSGLKLKYMNRNIVWFEREYAKKPIYFFFLIYLFLYKIPKNLIKIILYKKQIKKNISSFFSGIGEGLFSTVPKSNS